MSNLKTYIYVNERDLRLNQTHLDAKRVLQSPLKHGEDGVRLQINDEIWTASKHPERALAYISTRWNTRIRCRGVPFSDAGSIGDGKDDDLKGVPWPSSLHTLVRDIAHGVDGLVSNALGRLVFERMEQDAFKFCESSVGEVVVEGKTGCDYGIVGGRRVWVVGLQRGTEE